MSSYPAERLRRDPAQDPPPRQHSFSRSRGLRPGAARSGGLLCISAALLAYELLLLRLFSVLMWYHFASLAIALALLGLSAGAVVVGLRPGLVPGAPARGALLFGAAVLVVLGFLVLARWSPEFATLALAPLHQPFYKPFARVGAAFSDAGLGWRIAGLAGVVGLPFLGAGLALAAALAERGPRLHGAYGLILAGSGLGAALAPALLSLWSAPAALALIGALGIAAAAGLAGRRAAVLPVLLAGLAATALVDARGWAELPLVRGRYQPNLLAVRWSPLSRVAAYPLAPGEASRPFGLSPAYRGAIPPQIGLVVDDSGYTNLYEGAAARSNPGYFRSNLVSLAWHLRPRARSLVVGPGGGKDVWVALSFPETRVRAVEINPQVVEMVQEVFGPFTARPYSDPRVRLSVADARAFVARERGRYDVIEASAVFGRMPPAAGAFTLSEDFLHTREALEGYWERLAPRGILSITLFAYERRAPRLVALVRDLLDRAGIARPADHVRAVGDRGLVNVMVGRAPFGPADDALLREASARLRFRLLHPLPEGAEPTLLQDLLRAADLRELLRGLPYDLSPPTDDRPFFYYTLRAGDLLHPPRPSTGFDNRGALVLRTALALLAGLTAAGLVLPVLLRHGVPRRGLAPLAYVALVGAGYMLVEIGVLKRLSLFLGHPVTAAAAVLTAFLVGSGAGSLFSGRAVRTRRRLVLALGTAALLVAAWAVAAPAWFRPDLPLGTPARSALAALALFPLAFVLGIPFPGAMGLLGPGAGRLIPWCWAVSGTAGVLGSLLALLVAMHWGYTLTLGLGAALYAAAGLLAPALRGAS